MKHLLLPAILLLPHTLFAQYAIPNPGFEDWPGLNPVGWLSTNVSGIITNVTASSDTHSGAKAVRGEVILGLDGINPYPPSIYLQDPIPVSQAPTELHGFYQLSTTNAGWLMAIVTLHDAGGDIAGLGTLDMFDAAGYQEFVVPIDYNGFSGNPPVLALIQLAFGGDDDPLSIGTVFLVDDLQFTGVFQGIEEEEHASAIDLFPNPVPSGDACIARERPGAAPLRIEVSDMHGRIVFTTKMTTDRLRIPAARWNAGVYYVTSISELGRSTARLVVAH